MSLRLPCTNLSICSVCVLTHSAGVRWIQFWEVIVPVRQRSSYFWVYFVRYSWFKSESFCTIQVGKSFSVNMNYTDFIYATLKIKVNQLYWLFGWMFSENILSLCIYEVFSRHSGFLPQSKAYTEFQFTISLLLSYVEMSWIKWYKRWLDTAGVHITVFNHIIHCW